MKNECIITLQELITKINFFLESLPLEESSFTKIVDELKDSCSDPLLQLKTAVNIVSV